MDAHKNFAISLIAVAPVPAASGTTFSVTAGTGTLFPAAPFNVVVWPAGANPTAANAEVVRITSKGTGDNWTGTRTTESSSARSIALGDQIAAAITAKTLTDVEAAIGAGAVGRVPGGRLTLTTALPVTPTDVTAATTLYYTPYHHNVIQLYSGTVWGDFTFAETSIAVPATTSQMYDVFMYDSAGTPTLELLAWTNDTTRATALVRQDGHLVKTGVTTRLYLGSFRTTTVSGQTESSLAKRFLWNFYNRVPLELEKREATASWVYTTATFRQARATATNLVEYVVGVQEVLLDLQVGVGVGNASNVAAVAAIGHDSITVPHANCVGAETYPNGSIVTPLRSSLKLYPAVGYHYDAWLEYSAATGTATWYSTNILTAAAGLTGRIEG